MELKLQDPWIGFLLLESCPNFSTLYSMGNSIALHDVSPIYAEISDVFNNNSNSIVFHINSSTQGVNGYRTSFSFLKEFLFIFLVFVLL